MVPPSCTLVYKPHELVRYTYKEQIVQPRIGQLKTTLGAPSCSYHSGCHIEHCDGSGSLPCLRLSRFGALLALPRCGVLWPGALRHRGCGGSGQPPSHLGKTHFYPFMAFHGAMGDMIALSPSFTFLHHMNVYISLHVSCMRCQ